MFQNSGLTVTTSSHILLLISTWPNKTNSIRRKLSLSQSAEEGNQNLTLKGLGKYDILHIERIEELFPDKNPVDFRLFQAKQMIRNSQCTVFFSLHEDAANSIVNKYFFNLDTCVENPSSQSFFVLTTFAKINSDLLHEKGLNLFKEITWEIDNKISASEVPDTVCDFPIVRMGITLSWHECILFFCGKSPKPILDLMHEVFNLKMHNKNVFSVTQTLWSYHDDEKKKGKLGSEIGSLKDNKLSARIKLSGMKLSEPEFEEFYVKKEFQNIFKGADSLRSMFEAFDYEISFNPDTIIMDILSGIENFRKRYGDKCFLLQTEFLTDENFYPIANWSRDGNAELENACNTLIDNLNSKEKAGRATSKIEKWTKFRLINIGRMISNFDYNPYRSNSCEDIIKFTTEFLTTINRLVTKVQFTPARFSIMIEEVYRLLDHAIRQRLQGAYPLLYADKVDLLSTQRGGFFQIVSAFSTLPSALNGLIRNLLIDELEPPDDVIRDLKWNGLVVFGFERNISEYFLKIIGSGNAADFSKSSDNKKGKPGDENYSYHSRSFNIPYQMLFNLNKWINISHEFGHVFYHFAKEILRKSFPDHPLDEDDKTAEELFANIFSLIFGYNNNIDLMIEDFWAGFFHSNPLPLLDRDHFYFPAMLKLYAEISSGKMSEYSFNDILDELKQGAFLYKIFSDVQIFDKWVPNWKDRYSTCYKFLDFTEFVMDYIDEVIVFRDFFRNLSKKDISGAKIDEEIEKIKTAFENGRILFPSRENTLDSLLNSRIVLLFPYIVNQALSKDRNRSAHTVQQFNLAAILTLWHLAICQKNNIQ